MPKYDPDARHISGRIQGTGLADADRDLWDGGGQYSFPTSAQVHEVESDSLSDDLGGTGAEKLYIEGLDENYDEITEIIDMDGTSKVLTSNSYLRINRMVVTQTGSAGHNQGTIIAVGQSDSTVTAQINPSVSKTMSSIFSVPRNADFAIDEWWVSIGRAVPSIIDGVLLVRPVGLPFITIDALSASSTGENKSTQFYEANILVPAMADIKIRVGANDANCWAMGGYNGKYSRPANVDELTPTQIIPKLLGK